MKPAVLEVMRMNRVCRMVLVTSVGSFILVIFYFQSMLHPVMRRNPFGMDICCRKGSRSPLQELYNPTQEWRSPELLGGVRHPALSYTESTYPCHRGGGLNILNTGLCNSPV
uniref:Carbohydrate sulfotransferase 11 n=1 Tax=Dromaius novaehollandiae TaxID=8790 RepID=A0A8C4JIN6_DRONO